MKKTLIAILICLSVVFMAVTGGCFGGSNSDTNSEPASTETNETSGTSETGGTSESKPSSESKAPVEVGYKIEVYAETLDGTFVKTALDKTGTAGDMVVITAAILQAANVIPEGYNFDETDERNVLSGTLEENKSLSLTVYLKLKEYEVVFKNEDGTVLQSGKVKHGATPSYSGTPEKEADKTYTYAFKSWDKELAAANGDVTYTAEYDKIYIEYMITFDLANGEESVVATCHYGDPVTVPANPTKEGYTFLGWDKEIAATCDGNATYTAGYAENVEYTVKHVKKSVFGYSEVMETEQKSGHKQTDVTTFKKEYDDLVYIDYSLGDTETVVEFYYGADGITYNTPNFTPTGYTGYGSYTEKGKVTDGDRVYDNVYEASVTAGTDTAMLNIAYGDNVGKYLFLPIKQNYNYVGGDLQFIDGKGVYHNANDYPLWFDKNGNAIVYSTSNTDWMVMAVLLTEADYPKDGALNLNLFVWRLGTVQIGEYSFVSQDDFNAMFSVTYNTVNHYLRNIDGSFTLKDTETNVTCVIKPTAKTYEGHVYGYLNVANSVCDMFYELDGVEFNSATEIYKWEGNVQSYKVTDGEATSYDGKYRPATKKVETISQSGEGGYFGINGIGDKNGKYLVFAIKNAFTAIDPTVPQCNNAGNATISYFDVNGNAVTYDKNVTEWYIAVVQITDALAANGNIGLDFFCWSAGAVTIGDYAFVTLEQFNNMFNVNG